jgi:hypothetical protein
MLKMKEPPGMCMKTKVKVTKWTTIETAFCPTMHRLRGNSGRNKRSADLFAAFRACRDRFAAKRCGSLTPTRKTWGPLPAPAGESAGSEPPSPARGEGWYERKHWRIGRAPSSASTDLRPVGEGCDFDFHPAHLGSKARCGGRGCPGLSGRVRGLFAGDAFMALEVCATRGWAVSRSQ